jgi:TM2 domain-containing membrane protein YozV
VDTLLAAKKDFTPHELSIFSIEYEKKKKSKLVAWLLWLFFGGIGGHRYYLGHIGKGIAMTLTLGGFGIWALINAFFINKWVDRYNESIEREIIENIHALRTTAPPSTMAPPAP